MPPPYPTRSPLSLVRDFDWRSKRFYESLTTVDNDAKCWTVEKIYFTNKSDQEKAKELRNMVYKVVDLISEVHLK